MAKKLDVITKVTFESLGFKLVPTEISNGRCYEKIGGTNIRIVIYPDGAITKLYGADDNWTLANMISLEEIEAVYHVHKELEL